jgi:hypothetical protein
VAAATEEAQERIDNIKDELKLLSNAAQGVSAMDDAVEESKKAAEASKPRVSGDGRKLCANRTRCLYADRTHRCAFGHIGISPKHPRGA